MKNTKLRIAITMGDPAGIGPACRRQLIAVHITHFLMIHVGVIVFRAENR